MLFLPPPARRRASAAPRRLFAAAATATNGPVACLPRRHRAYSTTTTTAAPAPSPPTPLRPFPWPQLHVGTDICRISRVRAILATDDAQASAATASRAARFIRRILSPHEVAALVASASSASSASTGPPDARAPTPQVLAWLLAGGRLAASDTSAPHPPTTAVDPRLQRAAEFLAGRFAAKEAAIKAHPHLPQKLTFHQIRIVRRHADTPSSGPPVALVRVDTGPSQDVPCEQEARLSISHDGDYATAVCLGFDGSDSPSTPISFAPS